LSLPILILRPEPGATKTLERALTLGFEAICHPLFEIQPVPWSAPDPTQFDALLFTSANAVRHGGPALKSVIQLPVIAVGAATGDAARAAGFQVVAQGAHDINAAVDLLPEAKRILWLAGRDHRPAKRDGRICPPIIVYAAEPMENISQLQGPVVALIHSARAGMRLAEIAPDLKLSIIVVAMSAVVAKATGKGWRALHAAEAPHDDAMLALARRLCDQMIDD
jgi:uroporphyrinogen-III synthase